MCSHETGFGLRARFCTRLLTATVWLLFAVVVLGICAPGNARAATVANGATHSCAISSAGQVRCWGNNTNSKLGDGTTTARSTPVPIAGLTGSTALALGTSHSCALISGGTIKCWGLNTSGQLGDGTTTPRTAASTAVPGITNAIAITAGAAHTCALLADRTVKCWGANADGQIGDTTTTQRNSPTVVTGLTGATKIAAGSNHSCAIIGTTVKCWGDNASGQIGDASQTDRPTATAVAGISAAVSIAGGASHTCVALSDHTARCWGLNTNGQLGDGSTTLRTSPATVSGLATADVISAGGSHTCAADALNGVKCWGLNTNGQLGDGGVAQSTTAVSVSTLTGATVIATGTSHTCALDSAGFTDCWGLNSGNQLGDGTTTQRTTPTTLNGLNGVVRISAGQYQSCGWRVVGTVACWGSNLSGQLGDGTTTSAPNPYPLTLASITGGFAVATGTSHSCTITGSGQGRCWGLGSTSQLGDGNAATSPIPVDVAALTTATKLSGGANHTCAMLGAGEVKCWGSNSNGRLGDGTTTLRATPTAVSPAISNAIDIAVGTSHSCAIVSGGQAKCWGLNTRGQIGDNSVTQRTSPTNVSGLTNATQIAAGANHACAITATGSVVCWGGNTYGQLGDNSVNESHVPVTATGITGATSIEAGDSHTCAVVTAGAVKCWGFNGGGSPSGGELGDGTTTDSLIGVTVTGLSGAINVTAGGYHTCAAAAGGDSFCWGKNDKGQLGDHTINDQLSTTRVDLLEPLVNIASPGEGGITGNPTPSFDFNVIDTVALKSRECNIDGGGWVLCSSGYTAPSNLALGDHSFAVRVVDDNDNVGTSEINFSVATPPPTVDITAPANASATTDLTPSVTFNSTGSGSPTTQCKVDAGVYGACTSPFTTGTLTEAAHSVTVTVTDGFGNTASAVVNFDVDATAPVIAFSAPASGAFLVDTTPDVNFTVTDTTATDVYCQLDAGPRNPCLTTYTPAALADGPHTLTVDATDVAGTQSILARSFTIDTTLPVAAISTPAANAHTPDSTPDVSFTATDTNLSARDCKVDGGSYATCVSPYTPTALADGSHTVTVRGTDSAGNAGTAAVTFTVDTTLPVAAISSPLNNAFVATATPSITFTAADTNISTRQCKVDAGAYATCVSPYTTPSMADGAHTVTVRGTDAAGNQGTAVVSVTVDTTLPATAISSPAANAHTADSTPDVSFTATDTNISAKDCKVDAGSYATCVSPYTTTSLADGSHTVTVRGTDSAGNVGTATVTFTVDTTLPVAAISLPLNNAFVATATPSITFTATDTNISTRQCKVDAGAYATCTSPYTTPSMADGAHTVTVRGTDVAGNQGTSVVSVTVDTTLPVAAISTPAANAHITDSTPDVAFTATDTNISAKDCKVDAGSYATCVSPYTTTSLADGSHTVTVRGTDSAGNVGTAAVTFTVDTTLPVAAISSPLNNAFVATATPSITFTATDTNISTRHCKVDAGAYTTCISPYTTPSMADGAHTVTVRATDVAGNQGTAVVSITVDTTNPVAAISTPTDGSITASTQPSINFTSSDTNATTADCKVDGGAYSSCVSPYVPPAQSDGSHTISVRATDAAGNTHVAAVTATVDTTNPSLAISSPAGGSTTSNATPSVVFTVVDATATTKECKVDTGAFAPCSSPFAVPTLADGAHSITVRGTDAASNQNSVTLSLTVDTTLPVVTFSAPPAAAILGDATPEASFTVSDATATTTECRVDAGVYASCSSPFTAAPLADGAHSFTVRATDAAANQGTSTRSFTLDTALPVVTITSPISASTTGNASPDVTFSTADATTVTTECKIDAGSFVSCSSPFAAAGLSNASHTVTVRATDQAANQGTSSTTFTVDTTFPTVAISSPTSGSLTNDSTPSVTFGSTGSAPLTANCKVDGGSFASCTSPYTPAVLADGDHTITVQITDGLARVTSTSVSLTVDAAAPGVVISSPSASSVLSDSTPDIAFGITDAHSTTDECQVDAGSFAPCTTPFTAPALSDGSHSVTVRSTDTASNQNTSSVAFVVDTTTPSLAITAPLPAASFAVNTVAVTFTASDATSLARECKTDSAAYAPCSSPYTTPVLANGSHTVSVRVTDAASHQAVQSVSFSVALPVVAPPAAAPTPAPPAAKPVFAAAKLTAKQAKRKLKFTLTLTLPASSRASCSAPVSITGKVGAKAVKASAMMVGAGPVCTLTTTLKLPSGAIGKTKLKASFAGSAAVFATSASTALKVK